MVQHARALWLAAALLQLADIATTALAFAIRSHTVEANRTAAAIMNTYGHPVAYTTKTIAMTCVLFVLYRWRHRLWSRATLLAVVGLSALAVLNNLAYIAS